MSEIEGRTAAEWSYRSGAWFAVFGAEVTILLPASQKAQVVDLWSRVDDGADFDEVLDALLASGLSRIPGFVLVGAGEGATRFLLRGAGVSATVTTGGEDGETVTVEGGESRTWVERSVDDVTALSVTLPADDDQPTGEADLPILTGLVRVGRIDRPAAVAQVDGAAGATTEPAPGMVAAEVPADGDAEPAVDTGTEAETDTPADAEMDAVEMDAVELDAETDADAPADAMAEAADDVLPAPTGGAHLLVEDEASPLDEGAAVTERADLDEVAALEEPGPLDDAAAVTEAAYPDADPATEVMELDDPDTPVDLPVDALADAEADPAPAPAGWVTPWSDGSSVPPAPPAPPAPDLPPAPEAPAPPLPIGSWEPVPGSTPPAPPLPSGPPGPAMPGIEHDGFTVAGAGEPPPPLVPPAAGAAAAGNQPVAKLLISDGQSIVVDRAVLIGRAPEARRFTSNEQPTLVTVPSRQHEISSTHVEVRPGTGADLGTAVVTDMGSTNGTVLVQPGLGPEDLKPGIAVQLIPGATIDLGDGITIQVARP